MSHNKVRQYKKLEQDQRNYASASIVLGEILREHPELTGCIQVIGTYIANKMEANEKEILKIYGKHGEGLVVSKTESE